MKTFSSKAFLVVLLAFLALLTVIAGVVRRHGAEPLTIIAAFIVVLAPAYAVWQIDWATRESHEHLIRWKQRFHSGLGWILLSVVSLLAVGYLAKPSEPYDGDEIDSVTLAVLMYALDRSNQGGESETLYIRIGQNGDPSPELLAKLTEKQPALRLVPWSKRSNGDPECRARDGKNPLGRCGEDDFIAIDDVSLPFWRVARVGLRTLTCGSSVTAVKGMDGWSAISERSTCVTYVSMSERGPGAGTSVSEHRAPR